MIKMTVFATSKHFPVAKLFPVSFCLTLLAQCMVAIVFNTQKRCLVPYPVLYSNHLKFVLQDEHGVFGLYFIKKDMGPVSLLTLSSSSQRNLSQEILYVNLTGPWDAQISG